MLTTKQSLDEADGNLVDALEKILGTVKRRRWWILSVAGCIPMVVVGVAMKLPNRYMSSATLLVVQQQVSQRYVEPDSTTTIPAAVQAMKLEVLSSTRLLGIIKELDLYKNVKDRVPELLVERMRKDIDIQPLEITPGRSDFDAFTIAFSGVTPQLAQEVTGRLTSLFIEQNLRNRGEQAANTTRFLSDRLEAAKQKLAEQEQRLQTFKTNNLAELPEQQQTNLAAMTVAHERLQTVTSSLLDAQQRRASIESPLTDRVFRLQSERAQLLIHYTPQYPEVIKKDREISRVQAVLDLLRTGTPRLGKTEDAQPVEDPVLEGTIRQAEVNAGQITSLTKQVQQLSAESAQYQKHLNLTPLREQQLAEILRDYNLFKQDYTDLQNKKLQSELTTSLEERQEGQQFRLVDPPSLPVKPSSPKRLKICLGGMAGGLFMGVALAFLIDMSNTSLHDERTLARTFSLPLILGIPLVLTASERRGRRWRTAFEWLAGCTIALTAFAAELYVFRNG